MYSHQKHSQWVGSVDIVANEDADVNITVGANDALLEQEKSIVSQVTNVLGQADKVDAIICVAGGWAGGSASDEKFVENTDLMVKQSINSSLIASRLASKFLSTNGLLTLTGAKAALGPTPGMIGYGLAKAAVHSLTMSLAAKGSGLPESSTVLAILPVTLDTPMNRKWMAGADTSSWTPLPFLAETFLKWSEDSDQRPPNGSLVQVVTTGGVTELTRVDH